MSEAISNRKLDLEEVLGAAKDYAISTGVECLVLTGNGKGILNPCEGKFHSELCYCKGGAIGKCCLNTHFEGALKATDPTQRPAYYCPMGLLHWAAPIIIDGKIEAALIAGHTFLNQSPSELAYLKNITATHEELLKAYPELKKTLLSSPVITEERLNGLKRMLDRIAASFSDRSINDQTYRSLREAFRRHEGRGEEMINAIPWQKLMTDFDKKNSEILHREIEDVVTAMERSHDEKQCKAALIQIVLAVYDSDKESEGGGLLSDRCLNAMNDLERLKSLSALIQWARETLYSLLEAATIVPKLKNADMIYSALQYVEDHYSERFSLQDIAEHVHFSAPYFSKMFKKEMDITFTKYITNVRIEKSKQLLKHTTYPLADISAMVGFEEQSYFTRVFRTTTGISPGKYRESHALVN